MSAERFHPGLYLQNELKAHGWTNLDCAERMGGDVDINLLAVDMLITYANAPEGSSAKSVRLGQEMAECLSRALGVDAQTWMSMDAAYHARKEQP